MTAGLITLGVLAPFAALLAVARPARATLWAHLLAYVLPAAALDTLTLLIGVGAIAGVLGAGLAWLVTVYEFPCRRIVDGALLLPLAVPTYIVAYAYLDVMHPVGPVQEALRTWLGYDSPRQFRLPDIRSMAGCITLLGFVLYPYVYLPTRALFVMQSANLLDTGRTLGLGKGQAFLRIAVPLARPAIALGLSLALMETINDIGASEFMGVRTLTVSIYSTWVSRSDLAGAAQVALAMLCLVVGLLVFERWARRHLRFANDAQAPRPMSRQRLTAPQRVAVLLVTVTPIVIGFVVPFAYLVYSAAIRFNERPVSPAMWTALMTTVTWALLATGAAVACGLVVAYAARAAPSSMTRAFVHLASIGYATPGIVVAIGVLPVVVGLDRFVDGLATSILGVSTGLLGLGAGVAVLYAYGVRFLAIPVGGAHSGFSKVSGSLDDAAATLGASTGDGLRRVHLPLIRPTITTAALLMFVDCMKELPATLLLRPLGVETLATLLYGEAARGTYEDAAVAALLIVLVGLGPVWLLGRMPHPQR